MSKAEKYDRTHKLLQAGLEEKYFGGQEITDRLRHKLDVMWKLSLQSTMDWSESINDEIQGIKDYYAILVDLVVT